MPEVLFTGPIGPTAVARLARVQEARQRLDAEASEVLATVAEAQGHAVEPGVRFGFDLRTRIYEAVVDAPPTLIVPPADEERSA